MNHKGTPQKTLGASLILAAVVMLWLAINPYRYYLRDKKNAARDTRIAALVGLIRFLDDELTISARTAAITKNSSWEKNHLAHEPELDVAIKELSRLAPDRMMREFILETDAANRALVDMEHLSFQLGHQGKSDRAVQVLFGQNYIKQKAIYASGVNKFLSALEKQKQDELRMESSRRLLSTVLLSGIIFVLFGVWIMLSRVLAAMRNIEDKTAQLFELEHGVTAILAEPGILIELAPRIIGAICAVLGWEFGVLWFIDHDRNQLYPVAKWHGKTIAAAQAEEMKGGIKFKPGEGLPGRVWSLKKATWIKDVLKDSNFPRAPIAARLGIHGACGFPIIVEGEILGGFEFFSCEIVDEDEGVLRTMSILGAQIGQRIKRMQADSQVMQVQKMDAIGRFSGGIAHDFNNNLCCIVGLCDLLAKQLPPDVRAGDDVAEIKAVAGRLTLLAQQLLVIARKRPGDRKILDANELIIANEKLIRRLLGSEYSIDLNLHAAALPILVDPVQFGQVLLNLSVNARDAMPQGGAIKIASTVDETSAEIIFKDNGCGMDASTIARIFEPFFTTKEEGKGTGLGLSIVHGIMAAHGGSIAVESELEHGTVFRLRFPLRADKIETVVDSHKPQAAEPNERLILLVEDEPSVLRVIRRQLESFGHRVLAASSAEEAMVMFRQYSPEISLVITDVNMPKTNGVVLVQQLRAMRSTIRVLFVSGYGLDILAPNNRPDNSEFLPKPFSADVLAAKVSEMLAVGPK